MLPVWQEVLKPYVKSYKINVVGVVQEQHPDRARLYAQWRQLDWTILVDSLNLLDVTAVPVVVGLDESGIVRHTDLTPGVVVDQFLEKDYPPASVSRMFGRAPLPDLEQLQSRADKKPSVAAWRKAADAHFLHGKTTGLTRAIEAYKNAIALEAADGRSHFRLGVAYRRRYERKARQPGDAQAAVEHWQSALAIDPNQYIWRRRIQQYGPRLDKPYNFYFWIEDARGAIYARAEEAVKLWIEPRGSEIAPPGPSTSKARVVPVPPPNPDPNKRILLDHDRFVLIEPMVVPAHVRPGYNVRVRVDYHIRQPRNPWWNNEADDLAIWLDLPETISLGEGRLSYPNPKTPETRESRTVEFELEVAKNAAAGPVEIPAYSLYYVCERKRGKCRFIRQDFTFKLTVDPKAQTIR